MNFGASESPRPMIRTILNLKYQMRLSHRQPVAACLLPIERSPRHPSHYRSRVNPLLLIGGRRRVVEGEVDHAGFALCMVI